MGGLFFFSNTRNDPVVYKLCFNIRKLFYFTPGGYFSDIETWVWSITISITIFFFSFSFYPVKKKRFIYWSLNHKVINLIVISRTYFVECLSLFNKDWFFLFLKCVCILSSIYLHPCKACIHQSSHLASLTVGCK